MNAKTQVPLIRAFIILLVLNFFGTFVIPVSSLKTPGFVVSFSRNRASLFGIHSNELEHVNVSVWQSIPRAGGSASDVEDEDETEEDEDESTLSKATQASLEKIKKEQRENVKEIIQASLPKSKKDKKKKKSSSRLSSSSITIPYIIKALLNPFTVWSMTKGYFASLFNIDYIQEVSWIFPNVYFFSHIFLSLTL